jgi:guanosine-3',5'-bis(diphosphate) 3'-pyrophosphohydrolase
MNMEVCEEEFGLFIKALRFSAQKHRDQRRKGSSKAPYINHPIQLAEILWTTGGVRDVNTLTAAILHDTVEDTATTPDEIEELFGKDVRGLVMEMTDDKRLPKMMRKILQVTNASHKSPRARQIKLADKISNVSEICADPPSDWSPQRRREYLDWTEQVINNLRGHNPALEARYDAVLAEARRRLEEDARTTNNTNP